MRKMLSSISLSILFFSGTAHASFSQTFAGSGSGGKATFSLSGNPLSIKLFNNGASVNGPGPMLSSVGFSFSAVANPKTVKPWNNGISRISAITGLPFSITGSSLSIPQTMITGSNIKAFNDGHKDSLAPSGDGPYIGKGPVVFTTTVSGANLANITGIPSMPFVFGPNFAQASGFDGVPAPEPGFYGALALGLSGLFFIRRRSKA